jgi:hypothetical protein
MVVAAIPCSAVRSRRARQPNTDLLPPPFLQPKNHLYITQFRDYWLSPSAPPSPDVRLDHWFTAMTAGGFRLSRWL